MYTMCIHILLKPSVVRLTLERRHKSWKHTVRLAGHRQILEDHLQMEYQVLGGSEKRLPVLLSNGVESHQVGNHEIRVYNLAKIPRIVHSQLISLMKIKKELK